MEACNENLNYVLPVGVSAIKNNDNTIYNTLNIYKLHKSTIIMLQSQEANNMLKEIWTM